jgi:predicted thioesterase
MPESVEMPAPVSTVTRSASATQPDTSETPGPGVPPLRSPSVSTRRFMVRQYPTAYAFLMDQHPAHDPAQAPAGAEQAPGAALPVGLAARVELTVTDADTAQAVGSGDVPVLGTPRVLALAEAATVAATATRMATGMTTVGVRVELDHRAATPVGRTVVAQARLAKVDGRRLLFEVAVNEGDHVVAEGRVERLLVDRQRFVARAFEPR